MWYPPEASGWVEAILILLESLITRISSERENMACLVPEICLLEIKLLDIDQSMPLATPLYLNMAADGNGHSNSNAYFQFKKLC